MTRYLTEADARADGITIEHDTDGQVFRLRKDGVGIGTAQYRLDGESGINFNGTIIEPAYRGTGLSTILAARAVSDPVAQGRNVLASCWFMAKYIRQHPESLAEGATFTG